MGRHAQNFPNGNKKIYDNRDKEGVWIFDGGRMGLLMKYKCSLCYKRSIEAEPYCPGCGAKMHKEKNIDASKEFCV